MIVLRGRTITWQRVVGGLHLVGMFLSLSPFILLILFISTVADLCNFMANILDKTVDFMYKILGYVQVEYFQSRVVGKWVYESVKAANKEDKL